MLELVWSSYLIKFLSFTALHFWIDSFYRLNYTYVRIKFIIGKYENRIKNYILLGKVKTLTYILCSY